MSNLLGEPFEPWVTKQINTRQKSLGKYSTTQIQANLVKTPWIRLASSVDLEFDFESDGKLKKGVPQKLIDSGLDVSYFDGVDLAKNSILYGGVLSMTGENNSITQNSSINNGKSPFNGAYGWGGIDERGYVPMPGITDVSVQYQNNGALTKTTINIKCFSKRQFQIIDVLYLRPGYSLLLEFGHSTYLNNDGEYDSFENFSSSPLSLLFNLKDNTQYDIYREIAETRIKHAGNYEAVYGKITTFNWKFNPDGSYDCQVKLTGMGDVIESLKMNISAEEEDDVKEDEDDPPLIANKDKSELNNQLYKIFQTLKKENKSEAWADYKLSGYPNPNKKFKKEILELKNSLFSVTGVDTDGLWSNNQGVQTYITFGALMAIIQTKILLYDNRDVDTSIPLFRFDMEFDDLANDDNFILSIPGTFSADPRICLIPYTNVNPPIPLLKGLIVTDLNTAVKTNSYWDVEGELYVGRLAGILVNIHHIAKVLDASPLDEENNLNLIDFLKSLIRDITQTLGGINKITITTTEEGLIRFIEEIPQRLKKNESIEEKEYARFNTFGVKPGVEGSFLTSIDLNAELSNNFASMISIGSQANGSQRSGNATSFSNYNAGLKDRIIPEKTLSTNSKVDTNTTSSVDEDPIIKNFNKIANPTNYFKTIYSSFNWKDENIDTLTNLNTTHASLILGKLTQPDKDNNQQLQAPFFLPFNFSLEMEGLSGMKLYQKFKISEEILPPSYEKGGVDIQIKGINHTVNNSGWKTKLETQSVPAAKLSPIMQSYPLNSDGTAAGTAAGGGGGGSSQPVGNIGDLKSLTSGFPMAKIFYDGPTNKKQIYLHHTAGATASPSRTIEEWSKRTDHVATHYITNNLGDKEQLFADEAWANHLGVGSAAFATAGVPYQNLNKISLSIEMQSYGWCDFRNGKYINAYGGVISADKVGRPVDANGKYISYKGHTYYEKYNAVNIAHVKNIITGWMSKYGIPFVYNYDELFPNLGQPLTKKALAGTPGVYTHNSVRTDKSDVWPQAELIAMLKSISTG